MSIQSLIQETRRCLDTLKYNFNNLPDQQRLNYHTEDKFETVLDAMAQVKSSTREITQKVMERKK